MDSLELSKNMLRYHVIQPLNVYEQMIELLEGSVGSNNPGIIKLKNEHTWRHFGPPLFNYSLTALEVFLENFFLERYRKPDGGINWGQIPVSSNIRNNWYLTRVISKYFLIKYWIMHSLA